SGGFVENEIRILAEQPMNQARSELGIGAGALEQQPDDLVRTRARRLSFEIGVDFLARGCARISPLLLHVPPLLPLQIRSMFALADSRHNSYRVLTSAFCRAVDGRYTLGATDVQRKKSAEAGHDRAARGRPGPDRRGDRR